MYPPLNLPVSVVKMNAGGMWDRLRKKYVPATSEEWVRQHFINYLVDDRGCSEGRMVSEYTVRYNGMRKRADIVLFDSYLSVELIVECKAPHIALTEDAFYQIVRYNQPLRARRLILTNGLTHCLASVKEGGSCVQFSAVISDFRQLSQWMVTQK